MKRQTRWLQWGLLWAMAVVLAVHPSVADAQQHGGRGSGTPRGQTGVSEKDDLKDFKRAMALQATADQVEQFQQWKGSVARARQQTEAVLLSARAGASASFEHDLAQHADRLADALDEVLRDKARFLRSLSAAQKSGLKNLTKKLEKTSSETAKQSQALAQQLEHSGIEARQVTGAAERLDKALSDLASEQGSVGLEMGIQDEAGPASQSASAPAR